MGIDERAIMLELSAEEAYDLFVRCLKSADQDTDASREVLRKLAKVLDRCDHERRRAG